MVMTMITKTICSVFLVTVTMTITMTVRTKMTGVCAFTSSPMIMIRSQRYRHQCAILVDKNSNLSPLIMLSSDERQSKQEPQNHDRRIFASSFLGSLLLGRGSAGRVEPANASSDDTVTGVSSSTTTKTSKASAAGSSSTGGLLADLPMVRLKLPRGGFGREYVALKLRIDGKGPYEFMVDSGLTTELITPHLTNILGRTVDSKSRLSGLAAGGSTVSNPLIQLEGVSLCCGNFAASGDADDSSGDGGLPLPPLTAVITDFPQEHIDPAHDPVEGMIGMELLEMFDVDLDFPNNRIRFWKPGTADASGLVEIPAVVINESLLIGIRVTSAGRGGQQPFLGFLDCGSTFSCVNWKAANLLGLPPKNDPLYDMGPAVAALGVDGRPLTLPTTKARLDFLGDAIIDSNGRPVGFEPPPKQWNAWDPVQLAIGDIPVFSDILGDGKTPYQGPAALIGLDILSQRRVILEAGTGRTRARKVAVSPS